MNVLVGLEVAFALVVFPLVCVAVSSSSHHAVEWIVGLCLVVVVLLSKNAVLEIEFWRCIVCVVVSRGLSTNGSGNVSVSPAEVTYEWGCRVQVGSQ